VGHLDAAPLFASLIVSSVGFIVVTYGLQMRRLPQLVAGVVLLVYPYFITAPIPMVAVGVVLLAGMWLAIRLGW
jgi:hypothetical protein